MTAILETRNLSIQFGGVVGTSDISISVDTGEVIGAIGANGAGKTTFVNLVTGYLRSSSGSIHYMGNDVTTLMPREITDLGILPIDKGEVRFQDYSLTRLTAHSRARIGIGYMPEDRKLVPTLTVEENILLSFWATKNPKLPKRLPWVYEMIPEVTEFSARKAMDLSGGQQKLVALARALFCGTKLLLLDEPFEGVAPALAQRLAEVVADLKVQGQSVLLSESDHVHSSELLDRLYIIERGSVKEK